MKIIEYVKKLDIKSIFIIILAILLIVSFLLGQKNGINYHKSDLKQLKENNDKLYKKNDSLLLANKYLDKRISELNILIESNNKMLTETQDRLDYLNKRRNEIPTYINNLSATGVANEFSAYLNKNTKSTNNSKPKR